MKSAVVLLIGFICFATAWSEPAFCKKYECPAFSVLETNEGYELREYQATKWVSTSGRVQDYYRGGSSEMFMKLFLYISGENDANKRMNMTVPVLRELEYEGITPRPTKVTMHFLLPQEVYSDIPVPDDESIFITEQPSLNVYVRSFGGLVGDRTYERNLRTMMRRIGDRSKYDHSRIFYAGYDAPFTLFNRHNEVWLVAKD